MLSVRPARCVAIARSIHGLILSASNVTALGKVFLGASLTLVVLGVLWASTTLQANSAWEQIVVATPRANLLAPLTYVRYQVNVAALMAGWVVAGSLLAFAAIRAPFRIRVLARTRRRVKELEREVLVLRRLPLRQQEEDELLAAEAQLEDGSKRVMTEFVREGVNGRVQGERS